MHILWTLIVGGIAGWLASLLMKTDRQMGVVANVCVGVVGSALGYWIFGILGFAVWGGIAQWIVSISGAVLLIWILKKMKLLR